MYLEFKPLNIEEYINNLIYLHTALINSVTIRFIEKSC